MTAATGVFVQVEYRGLVVKVFSCSAGGQDAVCLVISHTAATRNIVSRLIRHTSPNHCANVPRSVFWQWVSK